MHILIVAIVGIFAICVFFMANSKPKRHTLMALVMALSINANAQTAVFISEVCYDMNTKTMQDANEMVTIENNLVLFDTETSHQEVELSELSMYKKDHTIIYVAILDNAPKTTIHVTYHANGTPILMDIHSRDVGWLKCFSDKGIADIFLSTQNLVK